MVRKPGYGIGDVVRLPLDVEGFHGYGRILRKERLGILVEFFGFASALEPSMEKLSGQNRILTIYCSDLGITQATWKVIGHLPVIEPIERPVFWHRSAITGKLYLRTHPDDVASQRETTDEEIHRLGAQPSGLFGANPALVRIRLATETDLRRIRELEEELAREGVHFDTGYSLEEALREWHLDRVEGPMTREAILRRLADSGFDIDSDSAP